MDVIHLRRITSLLLLIAKTSYTTFQKRPLGKYVTLNSVVVPPYKAITHTKDNPDNTVQYNSPQAIDETSRGERGGGTKE